MGILVLGNVLMPTVNNFLGIEFYKYMQFGTHIMYFLMRDYLTVRIRLWSDGRASCDVGRIVSISLLN